MNLNPKNLIRIAEVVSVYDEYDGGRIKVRLYPYDSDKSINDLPYAFPLLPKIFHITPKIGESVFVFFESNDNIDSQRYYIGPIIHQPQNMNYDPYILGATTLLSGSVNPPQTALSRKPEANGAMPKDDEVAIMGRKNSDIVLGENDIRIRCSVKSSKKDDETDIVFNRTNPTYIKLKYHDNALSDNSNSTISIVSENINLLSTSSKDYFDLADNKDLITDDVMNKILEKAHVLPYGDILVDFLKIFMNAFINHTHAYTGLPPVPDSNYLSLINFNLDDILSKNIRIN